MTFKKSAINTPGSATVIGSADFNKLSALLNGEEIEDDVNINNSKWAFQKYFDIKKTGTPTEPVGADWARIYVKAIDEDNDGLYVMLKKNGVYVETLIV